jgi:hypothetical protein
MFGMEAIVQLRAANRLLQEHPETPREHTEPPIDDPLPIVTESVALYKACKERSDSKGEGTPGSPAGRGRWHSAQRTEICGCSPASASRKLQGKSPPPASTKRTATCIFIELHGRGDRARLLERAAMPSALLHR